MNKKLLAFSFLFIFTTSFIFADSPNLANLIKDYEKLSMFKKTHINPTGNKYLIIIEDAHCNVPVQKEIRSIIKKIISDIKEKGVSPSPLLLQEGGKYGPIPTEILKKNKTKTEIIKYAEEKFNRGEMGAAEYIHLKEGGFKFWGIEDRKLYRENYLYFMKIAKNRPIIQKFLKDIKNRIDRLKTIILSDELLNFYNSIEKEVDTENMVKYLEELRLYILQYKIDIKKDKTIMKYCDTQKALKSINTEKMEMEAASISKNHKVLQNLKNLPELLEEGVINIKDTPELYRYARLKTLFFETDIFSFIKEKEAVEKELLIKMAYTYDEKELIKAIRYYHILSKILSFTLTNEEYEFYKELSKETPDMAQELINYIRAYYPNYKPEINLTAIYNNANNFYTAVAKRDKVLSSNIIKAMEENNEKIAVAVLGGFHTEGIVNIIKTKSLSYTVITPQLEENITDYTDTYYAVMEKFWTR